MDRELKRVPVGFSPRLERTWEGYKSPRVDCRKCRGECITSDRKYLSEMVDMILAAGSYARFDLNRSKEELASLIRVRGKPPESFYEISKGLAESEAVGGIFGPVDTYTAVRKVIAASGHDPDKWGICDRCDGFGSDPSCWDELEDWEPEEPPEGEAYQVWRPSDKSPVTPVFSDKPELAKRLVDERDWSKDAAKSFLDLDSIPS